MYRYPYQNHSKRKTDPHWKVHVSMKSSEILGRLDRELLLPRRTTATQHAAGWVTARSSMRGPQVSFAPEVLSGQNKSIEPLD